MGQLYVILVVLVIVVAGCGSGGNEGPPSKPAEVQLSPVRCGYRVVNSYPHDANAFTQGLVFHSTALYEGTGRYEESALRRVDLTTGEVLQSHSIPPKCFGEGITILGDKIFQLTWQSGMGFVYDVGSFDVLQTFQYSGEGWGLTHDGNRLIMSDGTSTIRFLDPETFSVTKKITALDGNTAVSQLNELEYVNGEIWANILNSNRIARIDPNSGKVTGWADLAGLLDGPSPGPLNGIAYDAEGDRLFVTGKLWPKLFEIEVIP